MELTQLRAFRTVAETQSFTRAAERLNLTQSAVSRQIGALEHELGEPLFVRGRRVVRLTGFGERTLSQVSRRRLCSISTLSYQCCQVVAMRSSALPQWPASCGTCTVWPARAMPWAT